MPGIRGSELTGIQQTANIIKDPRIAMASVPGGYVFTGEVSVFYLAVCVECGDMVVPFDSPGARTEWMDLHPHQVGVGVEVQQP